MEHLRGNVVEEEEEEGEGEVEAREHPEPWSGTEEYKLLIGALSHSMAWSTC